MSARAMTTAAAAAIAAPDVRPILLFEASFAGGVVRLWTGVGALQWAGVTWTGLGNLIAVSELDETSEVTAQGLSVTLSGVPPETVALALVEVVQGLPGRVMIGFVDPTGAVIPDPVPLFAGRLSTSELHDGEDTCRITVSYENRLQDLLTERGWRYTAESHRVLAPDDPSFDFVVAIQQKELQWNT